VSEIQPVDEGEIVTEQVIPPVEAIADWLAAKGCTLWADFIIDSRSGQLSAAAWMHKNMSEAYVFWKVMS
jgi:hypothetical protein